MFKNFPYHAKKFNTWNKVCYILSLIPYYLFGKKLIFPLNNFGLEWLSGGKLTWLTVKPLAPGLGRIGRADAN